MKKNWNNKKKNMNMKLPTLKVLSSFLPFSFSSFSLFRVKAFLTKQTTERANRVVQIERDNTMTLKGDNNLLRRKYDLFGAEFENLQIQAFEKEKEIQKYKKKIQDLEEVIVSVNQIFSVIFYNT